MRNIPALGVIPARIGSERLPRKPLHPIAGRPLIEWVWRRVREASALDAVVVATDSEEVEAACRAFGASVERTAATHASGTDRVAEVAARAEYAGYGVLVNVQGDEPFVAGEQIAAAVAQVRAGWDVGTVATPLVTLEALRDPGVVKVVRGRAGGALYFSRAAIPHRRDGDPDTVLLESESYLRHVGVYAYSRAALQRWVELEVDPLEELERLEQLRALRAGLRIGVALTEPTEAGVDTAEDVRRVEARLRGLERTYTNAGGGT